MKACLPYLDMQIAVINPKIIVSLGGSSIKALTNDESPINKIRKKNKEYNGIKLIPTFHPAAVLRNNILKKLVWEDMKKVMHYLKIGRL
jgi:DNA polymerase